VHRPKQQKKIYEVSLTCKEGNSFEAQILRSLLARMSIKNTQIAESHFGLTAEISIYFPSLAKAKSLCDCLKIMRLKSIAVKIKTLKNKDWLNRWKEDFKPFMLTKTIRVIPTWLKRPNDKLPVKTIFIDTVSAFGTGLHETTRFMSRLIEEYRGQYESFLDIGTGTGILTFVALRNGARKVTAFDYDRHAVEAAKKNFISNGHCPSVVKHADISKFKTKKQYDFVAANLITLDLIKFCQKIYSFVKPKKYLAVSGISLENFPLFRRSFENCSLRCREVIKGKEWVAVLYQKH